MRKLATSWRSDANEHHPRILHCDASSLDHFRARRGRCAAARRHRPRRGRCAAAREPGHRRAGDPLVRRHDPRFRSAIGHVLDPHQRWTDADRRRAGGVLGGARRRQATTDTRAPSASSTRISSASARPATSTTSRAPRRPSSARSASRRRTTWGSSFARVTWPSRSTTSRAAHDAAQQVIDLDPGNEDGRRAARRCLDRARRRGGRPRRLPGARPAREHRADPVTPRALRAAHRQRRDRRERMREAIDAAISKASRTRSRDTDFSSPSSSAARTESRGEPSTRRSSRTSPTTCRQRRDSPASARRRDDATRPSSCWKRRRRAFRRRSSLPTSATSTPSTAD